MTSWLSTLKTANAEEEYHLAGKLAFVVKTTQPDTEMRNQLRPDCAIDVNSLIAVSQVVSTYLATASAANDYWRAVK